MTPTGTLLLAILVVGAVIGWSLQRARGAYAEGSWPSAGAEDDPVMIRDADVIAAVARIDPVLGGVDR